MRKLALLLVIVSSHIPLSGHAETEMHPTVVDVGLSVSSYQYQEPGVMLSQGAKFGIDMHVTHQSTHDLFLRADVRYAQGTVDYTGSGQAFGKLDWYFEPRFLIGQSWHFEGNDTTGYTGFGYRYLFNDARGISSTGAAGYRRESKYFYLPVGLILHNPIDGQANLVSTIEYDIFIKGHQFSALSDAGLGYQDVNNTQSKGFGLKLSADYVTQEWSVGPFLHYWSIEDSDWAWLYQNGILIGAGHEPKNNTIEIGIRGGRAF